MELTEEEKKQVIDFATIKWSTSGKGLGEVIYHYLIDATIYKALGGTIEEFIRDMK